MTRSAAKDLSWWERVRHRAGIGTYTVQRLSAWALAPTDWGQAQIVSQAENASYEVWSRVVPLRSPGGDPVLEAGKRLNLQLLAARLHGTLWPAGQAISFWRTVGRLCPKAGYVLGAELRAGCVVPAIGGGVCLLTNALYGMGLGLGWEIVERHAHSLAYGETPPQGEVAVDATVFWPYVDLRMKPSVSIWLDVRVTDESLALRAFAAQPVAQRQLRTEVSRDTTRERRRILVVLPNDGGTTLVADDVKMIKQGPLGARNCLQCGEVCASRPRDLFAQPQARVGASRPKP